MKIAIQGIEGSYHHQVACNYFRNKEIEIQPHANFGEVAKSIAIQNCDFGLMAIENSIAGTLLPNYALISKYNLKICGEAFLGIQHQLMALPGTKLENITEVHSHPMALLQCDQFLDQTTFKLVEAKDTASAAKEIAFKKQKNTAAIASTLAAEIYGLEILASNIQTCSENYTRFFVLSNEMLCIQNFTKASIKFVSPHESGALVKVLTEISELNLNMEKIQSVPIIEKPWEYAFHLDVSFQHPAQFEEMIEKIKPHCTNLEVLGKYINVKKSVLTH